MRLLQLRFVIEANNNISFACPAVVPSAVPLPASPARLGGQMGHIQMAGLRNK